MLYVPRGVNLNLTFDLVVSKLWEYFDYCSILRPPSEGGLDLDSRNSGCARLGGEVAPPLGVIVEEVAVLVVLVRRHRHAVRAAMRRAVDDEVPGLCFLSHNTRPK